MKKRILSAVISVVLCVSIVFGSSFAASADSSSVAQLMGMLMGSNTGGSINLGEYFADFLKEQMNEESTIDKFVNNLKNQFNGSGSDDTTSPDDEEDVSVSIDPGAAENVAELFNITVNELKKSAPGFTKNMTASMDREIAQSLQGGLGVVTGLVESIIGTKDIFAGVLDGYNSSSNTVTTVYDSGNDIINNMSVSGQEYVACLTAEDIKDYTVTIYSSGAYKMHIDLFDVEGSAAQSGLAHVFDTSDKAFATIELGTTSINVNVKLKYTDCYVECSVNKRGEILSYTTYMGITFLFEQEDGTYDTVMPYFDVDFEKEGIIYTVMTEYTGFDYDLRLVGDADSDGKVNSTDARLVLRAASKLEELSESASAYCDVNGDSKISASDAREILRAAAKLTTLPTTQELLGISQYEKDESVQKHIDDLLVLLLAYQAADEEAKKQLQDGYDSIYSEPAEEETTTGTLNTTTEKIDDVIGTIGGLLGGDTSVLEGLF